MTPLETIVNELKALPPKLQERVASYVHSLKVTDRAARLAILRKTSGVLSEAEGSAFENALANDRKVTPSDW